MKVVKQEMISYPSAMELVSEAVKVAESMGIHISTCVVDINGRVKAKLTMDNASLIADELVERKAKTALLGLSTQDFSAAVKSLPEIADSMLQLDGMTLLGGGFPLMKDGVVIGGFAVGGATVEQDIECATTSLESFKD